MTQMIWILCLRKQEEPERVCWMNADTRPHTAMIYQRIRKLCNRSKLASQMVSVRDAKTMEYGRFVGVTVCRMCGCKSHRKQIKLSCRIFSLSIIDIFGSKMLCCEAVLCVVGYLARHPWSLPLDGRSTLSPQVVVTSNMSRHD